MCNCYYTEIHDHERKKSEPPPLPKKKLFGFNMLAHHTHINYTRSYTI